MARKYDIDVFGNDIIPGDPNNWGQLPLREPVADARPVIVQQPQYTPNAVERALDYARQQVALQEAAKAVAVPRARKSRKRTSVPAVEPVQRGLRQSGPPELSVDASTMPVATPEIVAPKIAGSVFTPHGRIYIDNDGNEVTDKNMIDKFAKQELAEGLGAAVAQAATLPDKPAVSPAVAKSFGDAVNNVIQGRKNFGRFNPQNMEEALAWINSQAPGITDLALSPADKLSQSDNTPVDWAKALENIGAGGLRKVWNEVR